MKKLFIFVFIMLCFSVLQLQNISFATTLNAFDFGEYSIFCDKKLSENLVADYIKNGDVYIYNFDNTTSAKKHAKNEDFLCIQMRAENIVQALQYIDFLEAKYVKSEKINNIKINYYFCDKLTKKTTTKEGVFNLAIAIKKDGCIIGYPAIMGSL